MLSQICSSLHIVATQIKANVMELEGLHHKEEKACPWAQQAAGSSIDEYGYSDTETLPALSDNKIEQLTSEHCPWKKCTFQYISTSSRGTQTDDLHLIPNYKESPAECNNAFHHMPNQWHRVPGILHFERMGWWKKRKQTFSIKGKVSYSNKWVLCCEGDCHNCKFSAQQSCWEKMLLKGLSLNQFRMRKKKHIDIL